MATHEQETDPRESNPNANGPQGARGDMGVSSERTGPTGPGQHSTDGVRPTADDDTDETDRSEERAAPAEQRAGGEETNPEGLPPKAGYSSKDPRSN